MNETEPYKELSAVIFLNIIQGLDQSYFKREALIPGFPVENCIVLDNVEIIENIFIDDNCTLAPSPVIIKKAIFKKYFSVMGGIFLNELSIKNAIFEKGVTIKGGRFKKSFDIKGGQFESLFNIIGGTFEYGFAVFGGTFNYLNISGGNFLFDINIAGGNFNKFYIQGNPNLEKCLRIDGGNFDLITLNFENTARIRITNYHDTFIQKFRLYGIVKKEALIIIQDVFVNILELKDLINNGQIYFNNIKCGKGFGLKKNISQKLIIDEHSEVEFLNIKSAPLFILSNSDLGKTTFIGCDLSGFNLDFLNSKISEIFLAGTTLFLPQKINASKTSDKNYLQDRLALSQIKKVYENMGDTVKSIEYNARELNIHLQYLKSEKKLQKIKSYFKDNGEIFQLTLNKYSSNHGQNWVRAFYVTLAFSVIMFTVYCNSIMGYSLNLTLAGIRELIRRGGFLLEFINPIRKSGFLADHLTQKDNITLSSFTIFWDSLSRITISYFLFQLVQAFRKHRKKN